MKRFDSPGSLGAFISICPPQDNMEEEDKYNKGYSREFQAMLDSLDQEDCGGELFAGKKRRLSQEQVKALEKHFEVENKLEPERKAKLADELGLQPRQVAIWFQNRRARWKTKQLEKDFGVLKANYNSLKLSYEDLQQQNQSLIDKVRLLKEKVCRGESEESSESLKEESPASENDDEKDLDTTDDFQASQRSSLVLKPPLSSSSGLEDQNGSLKFSLALNGSSSSSSSSSNSLMTNWPFQSPDISRAPNFPVKACQDQQHLMISPFSGSEEPNNCNNFFSVDQAPTLYWYFPHEQ